MNATPAREPSPDQTDGSHTGAAMDDVEVLRAEVRRLRADLLRERAHVEVLRRRVESAEFNASVSAEQARQLRQSTSWKVTAPLRRLTARRSAD